VWSFLKQFYTDIVCAIFNVSCASVPRMRHNFYKYWWDKEVLLIKETAIKSFNLWSALGKPRTSAEFDSMRV